MKLYNYRVDGRENIFPKKVYADSVDNSLRKWVDYVNEPETRGQDKTELKTLVTQGQLSQIKKVDNSQDTYFITLTKDNSHLTVFIDEIEITPDFIADLKYLPRTKVDGKDLQHLDIVLMLDFHSVKTRLLENKYFGART